MKKVRHLPLLAWIVAAAACTGNAPMSYYFPPPNTGVGSVASKSLDANGGSLTAAKGAAVLTVPAGALGATTAVSITVKDKALAPNANALMSQVFDFAPDGAQFAQPVQIALQAIDPPPTGQRATLAYLNGQQAWQVVPNSSYDAVSQTVTGAVTHFTDFAVLLVDAQGAGCAQSPDPNALCSPQICDLVHNACSDANSLPTASYHVGGVLTGLTDGAVTLADNGADALTLSTNGNFAFATALPDGSAYQVTVAQQPNNQLCLVTQGSGVLAGSDANQVGVSCHATYALGGSVTGLLAGGQVVLQNGNDQVTVAATAGSFVVDRQPAGAAYNVFIATQPTGQQCRVSAASGAVGMADVNSLQVICSVSSYAVGGQVQGLVASTQVTLQNGNDSIVVGNGKFTFPTAVAYGSSFSASLSAPAGETCAFVGSSQGTVGAGGVSTLMVACTPNSFTLGGQVSGLVGQTQVTLTQGNDTLAVGNGPYALPTQVAYGATYQIVATAGAGQTCRFDDGNTTRGGAMPPMALSANLTCTPATYSIGGNVTGLVGQSSVALQNGSDSIAVANGAFMFASSVSYGASYAATLTSPAGQTCVFLGAASGTVGSANVTSLQVSCAPKIYPVGGSVSGLVNNTQVVLRNGNDTMTVGNGAYTFPTSVAYASTYQASVTSPTGQTCTFSPANANVNTMGAGAVTNVNVVCQASAFHLGGSVAGVFNDTPVALTNGGDTLSAANGAFTFPTPVTYGGSYSVGLTNPVGQSCSATNAAGTMGVGDINNVQINCTTLSYPLGGTVSGLLNGAQVVVSNGSDSAVVGNGNFTFTTPISYRGTYSIGLQSPSGQSCVFSPTNSNTATMPAAAVSGISVLCSPASYSVGGSVTGLVAGTQVTLQNGSDSVSVGNGGFTLPTAVAYDASYSVSVAAPAGQHCGLGGTYSGQMPANNITDITVSCSPQSYILGGTVSGLMYNASLNLQNGSDIITAQNGSYTFPTLVPYASDYNVLLRVPGGHACVFAPNHTASNGPMPANDVSDIAITCQLVPYSIGVNVPSSVIAGSAFSATLSVLDLQGNVLTGYTGAVQISSSDASGSPNNTAQNVPFGAGNQGVVTVQNLQLSTLGQQTLVAVDAQNQVQGEATINVTNMFYAQDDADTCGLFKSGAETGEQAPVPAAGARARLHQVAVWPPAMAPALRVRSGRGVAGSKAYVSLQAIALAGDDVSAELDVFDVSAAPVLLHGASYLSYWVYVSPLPSAGQVAMTATLDDATHVTWEHPGPWVPNGWNHVLVPLGAYAGKGVARLGVRWERGDRGAFEVRLDNIALMGDGVCRAE